jgi:hypothetical protein
VVLALWMLFVSTWLWALLGDEPDVLWWVGLLIILTLALDRAVHSQRSGSPVVLSTRATLWLGVVAALLLAVGIAGLAADEMRSVLGVLLAIAGALMVRYAGAIKHWLQEQWGRSGSRTYRIPPPGSRGERVEERLGVAFLRFCGVAWVVGGLIVLIQSL